MTTHRRGTDLRDQTAHAADHQNYGRRSFLRTLGLTGAASLATAGLPATSLFNFPLATALDGEFSDRKLVLIRLKGGNDGLNTIVPLYALPRYRQARPRLAHADRELIGLNTKFAMPRTMSALEPLWDNDRMRVVNSVGYPDHNLSHFTGADIMGSGNSNVAENASGWLARHYVNCNPDYRTDPDTHPPAVKIGGPTSVVFNDAESVDISANFNSANRLEALAQSGRLFDNTTAPDDCYYGDQVLFLRTIANSANLYGTAIAAAYQDSATEANYTSTLGEQLRLVARLIKGGLRTQFYLVTLDGFDTHVGQNNPGGHNDLLENLSTAVAAFYEDLAAGGKEEEVLAMTYSEFGRRVEENGVAGTDHGTALPVMLFGSALNGSDTHGTDPDLDDLDATGNLRFGTDFRSLYATLLQEWLCINEMTVDTLLGATYPRLEGLGFNCGTTSTYRPEARRRELRHYVSPLGNANYRLHLTLPHAARVEIQFVTLSGQVLRKLTARRYRAGAHAIDISLPELTGHTVYVAYGVTVDGQPYGGRFLTGIE